MGVIISCIAGIFACIGDLIMDIVGCIAGCIEWIVSAISGCIAGICDCITGCLCCGKESLAEGFRKILYYPRTNTHS